MIRTLLVLMLLLLPVSAGADSEVRTGFERALGASIALGVPVALPLEAGSCSAWRRVDAPLPERAPAYRSAYPHARPDAARRLAYADAARCMPRFP